MARSLSRTGRRVFACAVASAAVTSVIACASLSGIDQLEIGDCKGGPPCAPGDGGQRADRTGSSSGDAIGPGADHTAPPLDCPTTPGPPMVQVGTEGNAFCIDSTETTVAQYNAFLASSPSTASQPTECSWNTTFTPDGTPAPDDLPQANVDWCDAYAYCKWAGKRLCGKIVGGANPGSPLASSDLASAQVDQWYIACSGGGKNDYPYGPTMKPGACNLGPSGPGSRRAPGTFPDCFGGSPGISDMLGNVWEWIDYCFTPPDGGTLPENMICHSRGGGFGSTEDKAKCDYGATLARRSGKNNEIGIRCCSP